MHAIKIHAGPRARVWLRERGLAATDVRVIPAAAGGPKGLALNPLDRFLFGHWLRDVPQTVHVLEDRISRETSFAFGSGSPASDRPGASA